MHKCAVILVVSYFVKQLITRYLRSWLLRLLELRLTNFPTYLLTFPTYLLSYGYNRDIVL